MGGLLRGDVQGRIRVSSERAAGPPACLPSNRSTNRQLSRLADCCYVGPNAFCGRNVTTERTVLNHLAATLQLSQEVKAYKAVVSVSERGYLERRVDGSHVS